MPQRRTPELITALSEDRAAIGTALGRRRLDRLLELDLSIQQLRIVLLVASGQATTGRQIAAELGVTPSTVSTSVDRLVDAGFLTRDDSAPDRRIKHLAVTKSGQAVYDRIVSLKGEADEYFAELSHAELEALAVGTAALRRVIERRAGPGADSPTSEGNAER